MKRKKYISAYLVVVNFCEEETYFFKNIEEMFKECNATSIKECIEYFTDIYSTVTIYRVTRSYSEV